MNLKILVREICAYLELAFVKYVTPQELHLSPQFYAYFTSALYSSSVFSSIIDTIEN